MDFVGYWVVSFTSTEAFIRQRLEEMERDNFMRLKRFKGA